MVLRKCDTILSHIDISCRYLLSPKESIPERKIARGSQRCSCSGGDNKS
ncbi:unnamed protein product [Brassica oleracea var. botrytis]|uniref:Uncharacterized protein n=2 Tax=Brassica TaxID=3705 RepID=A0A3P6E3P2_BRAOL|nr:unnamed protein product [Brassica napus]VDD33988.1 unnamed protein product [Brassica oleracea]